MAVWVKPNKAEQSVGDTVGVKAGQVVGVKEVWSESMDGCLAKPHRGQ